MMMARLRISCVGIGLLALRFAAAQTAGLLPSCANECASNLTTDSPCSALDALCVCRNDELWRAIICCTVATCDAYDAQSAILIGSSYCEGAGLEVDTNTKDCDAGAGGTSSARSSASSSSTAKATAAEDTSTDEEAEATETDDAAEASNTTLETSIRVTPSSSDSAEPTAEPATTSDDDGGGSSNTLPIGLGVGLGVGVPLTVGVLGYLAFLFWRTTRSGDAGAKPASSSQGDSSSSSSPPGNVPAVAVATPQEKSSDEVVELASRTRQELDSAAATTGDRHELDHASTPHELGYTPAPRAELSAEERQRQLGELA